ATLPELGEAVRRLTSKEGHPDAPRRRGAVRAAWESERAELARRAEAEAARVPIQPLTLVHELARRAPANAVIVDESISSAQGVRHFFGCADAKSFFGIRGGGIGWGLPAALGVKLALRDRPVLALVGDGSAMYTNQALWTAARESLAVVYVIFNNASYRILKQRARPMAVHQLLRSQLGTPDDAAHARGHAGRREPSRLSQDRGRRRRRPGRVREPAGEDSRTGPRLPAPAPGRQPDRGADRLPQPL